MKKSKPIHLKCKYCGYDWWSNSKLEYVSCPNCLKKNKKREIILEKI